MTVDKIKKHFLVLLISTRCNLSCRYCYMDAQKSGEDMLPMIAHQSIKKFLPINGELTVQFSGGEPLLHYDLIKEIVTKHRNRQIRFAVQTNGLLLTQDKLNFFLRHNIGLGLSLDGVPKVNENMRGSTQQVLKTLDMLDGLGIGINVTTVLTKESVANFPAFLLFCARYKSISTINLDLFRPLGRGAKVDLSPDCDQIKHMIPKMLSTLKLINHWRKPRLKIRELEQVYSVLRSEKKIRPYCLSILGKYSVVTPFGDVYPCPSLVGKIEYCAGNIKNFNYSSLIELTSSWELPQECLACPAKLSCRGGCPVRRMSFNGNNHYKYDVDCALHWTIYQELERLNTLV